MSEAPGERSRRQVPTLEASESCFVVPLSSLENHRSKHESSRSNPNLGCAGQRRSPPCRGLYGQLDKLGPDGVGQKVTRWQYISETIKRDAISCLHRRSDFW